MSDLYSKKARIMQLIAEPGGSERSNSSIAAQVNCDAKTVGNVRQELETENLRARVAKLESKLAAATQGRAGGGRPRRIRDDSRPLFERETEDGIEVICGML